jgi:hypothetical protein
MITSPGNWRPLNGLVGVIGMEFYPTRILCQTSQWNPRQGSRIRRLHFIKQAGKGATHRNESGNPKCDAEEGEARSLFQQHSKNRR